MPPDLPGWVGAGFCWQRAWTTAAPAPPDLACCLMWGAGSAWSPKGHGSQAGFTAESSRSPEKILAPGSTRTAGSLGSGPGHHTCGRRLPWATPGPAPLLWGPGCTWVADGGSVTSFTMTVPRCVCAHRCVCPRTPVQPSENARLSLGPARSPHLPLMWGQSRHLPSVTDLHRSLRGTLWGGRAQGSEATGRAPAWRGAGGGGKG